MPYGASAVATFIDKVELSIFGNKNSIAIQIVKTKFVGFPSRFRFNCPIFHKKNLAKRRVQ
jgi:hypothetical protein